MFFHKNQFLLIFFLSITIELWESTAAVFRQSAWYVLNLIQRDQVKWVCVILNEGYLRAAKRGSKKLYRFLIKI